MDSDPNSTINSVKRQGRTLKNTYIFLGASLMVTSISLAAFISLSHIIFDEKSSETSTAKAELDFNGIDKNSPVPLLMSAGSPSNEAVKVLGTEVTNEATPNIEIAPPATMLRDSYIRSFTFISTDESNSTSTVYASWNSRKSGSPQLYVIKQALNSSGSQNDADIYSIEGKGFEVSSHTFQMDSNSENLYLSIYELDKSGKYQLKDVSLVVKSSN